MADIDADGAARGVVAEGLVGARCTRSLRFLRYEVRRLRDGVISDIGDAVDSAQRLTGRPGDRAARPPRRRGGADAGLGT